MCYPLFYNFLLLNSRGEPKLDNPNDGAAAARVVYEAYNLTSLPTVGARDGKLRTGAPACGTRGLHSSERWPLGIDLSRAYTFLVVDSDTYPT